MHFLCGASAGFTATVVGSPLDVIKTRIMNQDAKRPYKNPIECVTRTAREEGLMAFYKGFTANFARIASWNIVMFISLEQIKANFFAKHLD